MIPKFRAWHESEQEMLKDIWFDWQDFENYGSLNEIFRDKRLILMQSTGLFDKNGVEIFEGDVIVAMSQGVKAIGEVKRRTDGCWLMYPAWQHGELWHIVENVDTGETGVEVIGNIHEHPELVEAI